MLKEIPEARLVAVADVSKERAKEAAEKFGVETYYTDYRQLLKMRGLDVVHICTPPYLHREHVEAAAEAGKHIICEKPICTNLKDADRIIKAAQNAKLKLTIDFMFRFHPLYLKVKQMIDDGSMGKPVLMWFTNMVFTNPAHPWFWDKSKSGGMLVEHVCHFFDILRWWAGEPQTVSASVRTLMPRATIEDNASVIINYKNHAIGSVAQSFTSSYETTTMGLLAEKGTAELLDGWYPSRLRFLIKEQSLQEVHTDGRLLSYKNLIKQFIECVREDKKPLVTGEDGKAALKVALASYQSAKQGVPVTVT